MLESKDLDQIRHIVEEIIKASEGRFVSIVDDNIKASEERIFASVRSEITSLRSEIKASEDRVVTRINAEITDLAEVNHLALNKLDNHEHRIIRIEDKLEFKPVA